MSKGIIPKVKKSTITKDAKINKATQIQKKDLKMKHRHDTWSRRIEDATKEKVKVQKMSQAQPLSYLDPLTEQLDSIESRSTSPSTSTSTTSTTRPDLLNPHLKRVVSSRGRKMTLKREQDQFMKVLGHPAFQSNPLGAIGMHLSNTINQIKSLPKKDNK